FAAGALPGSFLGAYMVNLFSTRSFHIAVGILLVLIAVILLWRPHGALAGAKMRASKGGGLWPKHKRIVDAEGQVFEYSYDRVVGLALSFVVGFLSSLLGIGGGVIHVPALLLLPPVPAPISPAPPH